MDTVKAGGRKKSLHPSQMTVRQRKIKASNEHAYTLEEVAEMLDKLPEPARTVCAVAAFTGLTRSELRGLKWEGYDGKHSSSTEDLGRPPWSTEDRGTRSWDLRHAVIA
jgi:integrase